MPDTVGGSTAKGSFKKEVNCRQVLICWFYSELQTGAYIIVTKKIDKSIEKFLNFKFIYKCIYFAYYLKNYQKFWTDEVDISGEKGLPGHV